MVSHFGEALQIRRKRAGISRAALARKLDLQTNLLARIESSASVPDPVLLERICIALNVPEDEFLLAAGVIPPWLHRLLTTTPEGVLDALRTRFGRLEADTVRDSGASPRQSPKAVLETSLGKLFQADCLAFLRDIGDDSADLVFADPPFNLNKQYGQAIDDSRSEHDYMNWCLLWLAEVIRVLKPGGSLFLYNIPKWNVRLGGWLTQYLEFRHWIAVDIKFSLPIPGRLYPSHYALLYFSKGQQAITFNPPRLPIETCRHCGGELRDYGGYKDRMNPRGVNVTDVWTDLAPVRHARFKRRLANELPLKLLDRVLDIATKEGDLVLDPFGGSGTTFVAAELKGRRWLGCELEDCSPIKARFQHLDRERDHLREIREKINVLFTPDSLSLRRKHGHDTSKYRTDVEGSTAVDRTGTGRLFD